MENPQTVAQKVVSTWPYQDSPAIWVDAALGLLAEPNVAEVFVNPKTAGGGSLSFRCDGVTLGGPQFSKETYDGFIDAVRARLKLQSADGAEGVLCHDDQKFFCALLSTHRGTSVTLHERPLWNVAQPFRGWPVHAVEVVETMRAHPNGLMVFCHRPFSTTTDSMSHLFRVMQQQAEGETRFGFVSETFANLPLNDETLSIRVTAEKESWDRALSSLALQGVDVCAMSGRDDAQATAQAALFALEDRSALVNVSLLTVTDTLLWLTSELRVDPLRVAEVTLGVVGTYRGFRRVCSHCRQPYQPDESSLVVLKSRDIQTSPDEVWMRGQGCDGCNHTGATPTGAMIAEATSIDRELTTLLASRPQRDQLTSALAERGFITYFDQMMEHARQGDATLEEAIRVGLARRCDL